MDLALACPSLCNDMCFILDSAENCLKVLQLQFIFDGLVHKTVEVPQLPFAGVVQYSALIQKIFAKQR